MRTNFDKRLRLKAFFIGAIAVLLILPAFAPAQEEKTPGPPDIEIFMKKGIYQWSENNPYMKQLAATRFWEDLQLSGQFIGLLTLGAQLENQTGVHLGTNYVRELLDAPVEISIWNAFERNTDNLYVMVLDVDPKYQALVKLAEVYAQSIKKSTIVEKNKLKILKTQWLDNSLFHIMLKNQLVVSNDLDTFLQVVGKASKDGTIRTFRDSDFYKNYHNDQEGNFKFRVNIAAWVNNLKGLIDKNAIQLAVNMDLSETVNIYSLYLTAAPGFRASETCALDDCKDFIPREPIMAAAGLYNPGYYTGLIKELPNFIELSDELKLDVNKQVIPFFKERFFLYMTDLQDKQNPNIINGVMGFSLSKYSEAQRVKINTFVQAVMTRTVGQMDMEKDKLGGDVKIYRFKNANEPAFCMVENWLLVGSSYNSLTQSLSVYHKKIPSVSDGKGYQSLSKALSTKGFCQILLEPSRYFGSLVNHLLFVQEGFGAADVKLKIQPAAEIFAQIPPFGIFWELQKDSLKGTVRFAGK